MYTTLELLDMVKEKHHVESDYALGKLLQVTPQSICKHRKHPHGADDALALRIARLVDLPPEFVLMCAAADRAKCTEERDVWRRAAALTWVNIQMINQQFSEKIPRLPAVAQ